MRILQHPLPGLLLWRSAWGSSESSNMTVNCNKFRCHTLPIISNLIKRATCVNSIPSLLGKKIFQANMNVIQDIFSLLCGVIVPLMILYFLMSRTAMQREPVENDERPVLASRTTTNGERRWTSENISLSIQPSRNFPTEHDERYDWSMTPLATD